MKLLDSTLFRILIWAIATLVALGIWGGIILIFIQIINFLADS